MIDSGGKELYSREIEGGKGHQYDRGWRCNSGL